MTAAADAGRAVEALLARLEGLDAGAELVQGLAREAARRAPGMKDALSGTWLGHPLHPPLTDVVVGAWTGALVLDVGGGPGSREAADRLVALGVLAAVPTAATGLSDWAELRGGSRRVGTVHGVANVLALTLQSASWLARRGGRRRRGIALSMLGYGVASASAWLGGELAWHRGIGVDQTAFETQPEEWTAAIAEDDLPEGELVGASAGGAELVLVRRGDAVHALADRCSHRGCALHEGSLVGDTVVCACHGSTFRLDGSISRGPATCPQPTFDARINDGVVEVRRRTSPR